MKRYVFNGFTFPRKIYRGHKMCIILFHAIFQKKISEKNKAKRYCRDNYFHPVNIQQTLQSAGVICRTPNAEPRTPNAGCRTPNDCLSAVYLVKHVQSGTRLDLSTTVDNLFQCQFLGCNQYR